MALANVSQPRELKKEDTGWGTLYTGTAEQIVAAGLANHDQFPGMPGRGKICCTYYAGRPVGRGNRVPRDEQYLRISRKNGVAYVALVGYSAEQNQQYEEVQSRQWDRENRAAQRMEEQASAAEELGSMPQSRDEYRRETLDELGRLLRGLTSIFMLPEESHGYSYSAEAVHQFQACAERLCVVLRNGQIDFNQERHNARIKAIKAKIATTMPDRARLRLVHSA